MRTFSYGGGVQSTAALVLAAHHIIDFPVFLFANVGDDSENPDTLEFVERYAKPFAERHRIQLIELRRTWRDGRQTTLYEYTVGSNTTLPLPAYMHGGVARRICTTDWKREVIAKWHKQKGASKDNPFICGLGISLDEIHRMRLDSNFDYQTLEYPLIDLHLTREDCVRIIEFSGMPVPPKSSCWFCPFHRKAEWEELRATKPELFRKAIALEDRINEKRRQLGRDAMFLHSKRKPLALAVKDTTPVLASEDNETCDTGHCFV